MPRQKSIYRDQKRGRERSWRPVQPLLRAHRIRAQKGPDPLSGRRAYTLLEVLIATAVGVLLMGALYMAINVQIRHTEAGREVVEQAQLVRAIFARIDRDIRLSLGPPLPSNSSSSSSSGASTSPSGSGTSGSGSSSSTTGTSGTSTTGSGSSTSSNSSSSSSSSAAIGGNGPVQFNLWVQGDTNWVMLYVSRVPRELLNAIPGSDNANQPMAISDLRRVSYWLGGGGDSPSGLARQEITAVTSLDAISNVPPNIPDDDPTVTVIAPEVKSLTLSYWDGTTWQDTWDGTQPGPDGSTPVGPPLAIAVTLGIAPSGSENNTGSDQPLKQYRHVVPIMTANGAIPLSPGGTTTTTQ